MTPQIMSSVGSGYANLKSDKCIGWAPALTIVLRAPEVAPGLVVVATPAKNGTSMDLKTLSREYPPVAKITPCFALISFLVPVLF